MRSIGCLMLLSVLVFSLTGCGGGSGPATGTVTGTVTLDGQPVEDAQIVFRDPTGQASSAGGKVSQGQFSLESPLASMRVEITAYREIPGKFDESNPGVKAPLVEQYIPKKYNESSELTVDVKPGSNELNFALTSDSN